MLNSYVVIIHVCIIVSDIVHQNLIEHRYREYLILKCEKFPPSFIQVSNLLNNLNDIAKQMYQKS